MIESLCQRYHCGPWELWEVDADLLIHHLAILGEAGGDSIEGTPANFGGPAPQLDPMMAMLANASTERS